MAVMWSPDLVSVRASWPRGGFQSGHAGGLSDGCTAGPLSSSMREFAGCRFCHCESVGLAFGCVAVRPPLTSPRLCLAWHSHVSCGDQVLSHVLSGEHADLRFRQYRTVMSEKSANNLVLVLVTLNTRPTRSRTTRCG